MSGFFGGDGESQETSSTETRTIERSPAININSTTGGGAKTTLTNPDGRPQIRTSLSPRVRRTIGEGLSNSRSALSRIETTIADLRSNTNAFINARVNPLEEAVEQRIAQQGRSFAERGIFGGLASQETDDLKLKGEREIGNARALATQEALQATLASEGVAGQINNQVLQAADRLLQADLAELGINFDALRISQASRLPTSETVTGSSTTETDDGGSILGDIATIGGFFL